MVAQGTILCVDQRFIDWFGRSPGELVGRPFNSIATEQVCMRVCVPACTSCGPAPRDAATTLGDNLGVCGRVFATQDVLIKLLDLANASTEAEFAEGRVATEQVLSYGARSSAP